MKQTRQCPEVIVSLDTLFEFRIQEQLEDTLKIASCREQYLKARIDKMKV